MVNPQIEPNSQEHTPVSKTNGVSTPQNELRVYSRRIISNVNTDIVDPTHSQENEQIADP